MARKRKIGGANVSLFAFQDIITAVSGILILIVIFLILMLERPGLMVVPVERNNALSLDELETLVSDAKERIREVEFRKLEAAGASPEELRSEIAALEASLRGREDPAADRLRKEISALRDSRERIATQVSSQEAELARLRGIVDHVRGTVESKADALAIESVKPPVWLVPGEGRKKPVVVSTTAKEASWIDSEDPDGKNRIGKGEFLERLRQTTQEDIYFLFYVRPDGIELFRELSESATAAGFDIGYRPIGNNTEVRLLVPEDPSDPAP